MFTCRNVVFSLARPSLRAARFAGVRYHSIHSKYADKLAKKASEQGLTVEELLARAKPKAEEVKRSDVADLVEQAKAFRKPAANSDVESSKATGEEDRAGANPSAAGTSQTGKNNPKLNGKQGRTMELDSFIDVEKFKLHSTHEIELLWKTRFLNQPGAFSGTMLPEPFSRLYINAKRYPTFVLPLPHKAHGIELHYVQWHFVSSMTLYCLITSLAQYKLHGEYAQPHTTFMLHTDLAADKQIILTNAVVQGTAGDNVKEAALLVLNLQRFYTASPTNKDDKTKLDLLRKFNTGDTSFKVEDLISETDKL